jgi:hypothetical protein
LLLDCCKAVEGGTGMEAVRYLVLALLLGGLTVWGSENMFWMMPPPGITPLDFALTVVAYSIACAVALSAVIWAGVGGVKAAFLGGAIVGYMSEGVIVGTIYQPAPPVFYLIWTPLAWHALITGGLILGLGRVAWSPWRRAAMWTGLGLAGAFWAQYWPSERGGVPDQGLFTLYILGLGLLVPLAQWGMDRMGHLPRPRPWVLWVAPAFAAFVWGAQGVAEMNPYRLILVAILALLLWVMRRLGQGAAVSLGPAVPVWHHLLFLIAPALMVVVAPVGWAQGWGTLGANWVVAFVGSVVAVVWLGRLVWSAARQARRG